MLIIIHHPSVDRMLHAMMASSCRMSDDLDFFLPLDARMLGLLARPVWKDTQI